MSYVDMFVRCLKLFGQRHSMTDEQKIVMQRWMKLAKRRAMRRDDYEGGMMIGMMIRVIICEGIKE